ncbi:MAG: zinc-dependent metalloprotease [Ilumatobacteraceae bacterium]
MTEPASPIDWGRAERVAVAVSARLKAPDDAEDRREPDWNPPITQIEQQIEDVTGLRSSAGTATVELIDRHTWIRANIDSFRQLLAPVLERWSAKRPRAVTGMAGKLSGHVAGAEIGVLLGWMSGRVLGQYDLLVGRDDGAGAVYLVGPNLAAVEQRFGFDPAEFRNWVLVHELTHRAQFTGVPWMRQYFRGLVDESMSFIDPDPAVLLAGLREAFKDRHGARQNVHDHGLAGLLAGPEQRAVIDRVGGLMSLLEGHGDVTMTRAAGLLVPSADRYARVLAERRRRSNPVSRVLLRLTGMEAKLNQYAAGERFIHAVESEGGPRMIDTCWERAEHLPSLDEIRTPSLWLARMGVPVA